MRLPRPTTPENLLSGVTQLIDALETRFKAVDSEKLDGIDSLGFLQLAAAANRKVAFGSATLTYPGGAVGSNPLNVTHGLGVTPVVVLLTVTANSGLNLVPVVAADTYGATTFRVFAHTIDGQNPLNTATTTFVWLAIG